MKSEMSIMPRPEKTVSELVSDEWLRRNSSYSKHRSSVIPTGLHTQRARWIMQKICYHNLQEDLRGTRLAQWWSEIAQWSKIFSNYDIALASESAVSDYEVVLVPRTSWRSPYRTITYCQEAEANVMLVDEMAPSSDGAKLLLSSLGDIIFEYCRLRLRKLDAEAAFSSFYNGNEYPKDFIMYDPRDYSLHVVEIDGIYIPFREVEVLCCALKGQTDHLSDDELAWIVGSKLDPIALEALSQIESQMNDLESEAQAFNATGSMSAYYHKIDKLRSEAKNIRKKAVEACIKRREGVSA